MAALSLVWEHDTMLVTGACPESAEDSAAGCWRLWRGRVERWGFDWYQPQGRVVASRHRRLTEAGVDSA